MSYFMLEFSHVLANISYGGGVVGLMVVGGDRVTKVAGCGAAFGDPPPVGGAH